MITSDPGRVSFRTAPFDEMTRVSSMVTPGSERGSDPVARITARASSVVVPAEPVTSTVVALFITPRPGTRVILFLRNRNSTPLAIRSATRRLRRTASA